MSSYHVEGAEDGDGVDDDVQVGVGLVGTPALSGFSTDRSTEGEWREKEEAIRLLSQRKNDPPSLLTLSRSFVLSAPPGWLGQSGSRAE